MEWNNGEKEQVSCDDMHNIKQAYRYDMMIDSGNGKRQEAEAGSSSFTEFTNNPKMYRRKGTILH